MSTFSRGSEAWLCLVREMICLLDFRLNDHTRNGPSVGAKMTPRTQTDTSARTHTHTLEHSAKQGSLSMPGYTHSHTNSLSLSPSLFTPHDHTPLSSNTNFLNVKPSCALRLSFPAVKKYFILLRKNYVSFHFDHYFNSILANKKSNFTHIPNGRRNISRAFRGPRYFK